MFSQNGGGSYQPPDMAKIKRYLRFTLPALFLFIAALTLAFDSFYTLNDGEESVVLCWGSYARTETESGLKFKLPFVEEKTVVNVDAVRRLEFGAYATETGEYVDVMSEALMLTQEENLVMADWVVQYRVSDSYNYLYKVENLEQTLRTVSQSAYRRVTAAHPLDDILTNRKNEMQIEIMNDLQEICNKYEMGVRITAVQLQDASPPKEVSEAFLDVTRAIEDKNTAINEAHRYENEQLPVAQGQAEALINEAEAYREKRVNEALGAVSRYQAIESEYSKQPDIMRTRLYLEMIRDVLPAVEKVYFLDQNNSLLEILNLNGNVG